MAKIKYPNYNDQLEQGGIRKSKKVRISSIQGEYGRKRTLCQGSTIQSPQSMTSPLGIKNPNHD